MDIASSEHHRQTTPKEPLSGDIIIKPDEINSFGVDHATAGGQNPIFGAGELTRDLFPVVNVVYIIDVYIVFYCCLHVCFPISFMLGVIILIRGVQPVSVSRRVSGIGVRLKVGDKY